MAYTQKQYDDLCAAIALGAKSAKYSDKEVDFRSLSEMKSLKREMEKDLGISTGSSRKTIAVYSKGLRN